MQFEIIGDFLIDLLSLRYDFIPDVLDRTVDCVDVWVKIGDDEAFPAALRLIRTEALLVGGSSGSALAGALKWLKSGDGWRNFGSVEGKNVVLVLPDGYVVLFLETVGPTVEGLQDSKLHEQALVHRRGHTIN